MSIIDTVRYAIALLMVVTLPFAFIFWLIIHPFARFWRRLGPAFTYTVVTVIGVVLAAIVYRARSVLLAIDYGTNLPLLVFGLLLIIVAMIIAWQRRRFLTWRILAGVPELSDSAGPGRLLKEGIYGRIRHPRYIEAMFGLCGYALISNFLATYVACGISFPVIYLIVVLEERELRMRFGSEYDEYCHEVPRFVPRFSRPPRGIQPG